MFTFSQKKKYQILAYLYILMSLFIAFIVGTFAYSFFDARIVQTKLEPWVYIYFGIPTTLFILFYGAYVYFSRRSAISKEKNPPRWPERLLVSLGYIGMIVTLFFMWYTRLTTTFFTDIPYGSSSVPLLYDQLAHGGIVAMLSIIFGWLHGKRVAILTFLLVLLFLFFVELGSLRITYCEHMHPTTNTDSQYDPKITREEKEFMKYWTTDTIAPYMRDRVKCEKSFPLNFFINNSHQTYLW